MFLNTATEPTRVAVGRADRARKRLKLARQVALMAKNLQSQLRKLRPVLLEIKDAQDYQQGRSEYKMEDILAVNLLIPQRNSTRPVKDNFRPNLLSYGSGGEGRQQGG